MSSVSWAKLQFVVFDCPNPSLLAEQYVNRYKFLSINIPSGIFIVLPSHLSFSLVLLSLFFSSHLPLIFISDHLFVQLAPYVVCKTRADVETVYSYSFLSLSLLVLPSPVISFALYHPSSSTSLLASSLLCLILMFEVGVFQDPSTEG